MKYLIEARVKNPIKGATVYDSKQTDPKDLFKLVKEHDALIIPTDGSCEFDAGFFAANGKPRYRLDDAAQLGHRYLSFGPEREDFLPASYEDVVREDDPEEFIDDFVLKVGSQLKGVVFGPSEKNPYNAGWRGRIVGCFRTLGVPVYVVDPHAIGYHSSVKRVASVEEVP